MATVADHARCRDATQAPQRAVAVRQERAAGDGRLPDHPRLRSVRRGGQVDRALPSRGDRLRRHAVEARRGSTGSAPTSTAVTCSAASSTARALRWPSASFRRSPAARWAPCWARRRVTSAGASTPPSSASSTSCCRSRSSCWPWWWWPCSASRMCWGVDVNLIAAIALPIIPKMARVARSSTLSIVAMPFIDAARAAGFSHTPHHPAPHPAQHRRALPDHGDRVYRPGDPVGGEPVVPGIGGDGADAGLGPDAVGNLRRLLPDGAVDDPVPRHRHHACRVRLQPVRRFTCATGSTRN